jgi:hypothetical protein
MALADPVSYLHDNNSFAASGREGNQYPRNPQCSNFDQIRMPMPPKKKIAETMDSKLIGNRYVDRSLLRFHSSLALRRSAGEMGVPNRCAEAVSAMNPAMVSIRPTI